VPPHDTGAAEALPIVARRAIAATPPSRSNLTPTSLRLEDYPSPVKGSKCHANLRFAGKP
jgi:hypothetical protein